MDQNEVCKGRLVRVASKALGAVVNETNPSRILVEAQPAAPAPPTGESERR
jgi:hypothetical protein